MRFGWGQIALVAAALLASSGAEAQRAVFVLENDAIAKTDRDYTNGFRQSFVFDDFNRDILAGQFFDTIKPALITLGAPGGPVKQQIEWIALAQSIYTPDKINTGVHTLGVDRPFGGWLYTGFTAAQESGRSQLDTLEVQVGAVGGRASFATAVQDSFHRLLGQTEAQVNGYELRDEPGFLVAWDRRWKFGADLGSGFGVDLIPAVGFTGGNVFTYGSAGAIARIGRSLGTTWGPTSIRPGVSGASFISPDPAAPLWGFDFFGGFEARAVARNIFLDGNTFGTNITWVTKKPFVYDLVAGAEVFTQSGFGLSLSVTRRSKEYTTQVKPSTFGSLAASYRF